MVHQITAIIGSQRAVSRLVGQFGPPTPTNLPYNLVIVPLNHRRLNLLRENQDGVYEGFTYLNCDLEAAIISEVGEEPVLYIETEYSGGMGAQGAALFAGGILQWKQTASTNNQPVRLLSKTPISRGLAELGVPPSLNRDEFDCVDLVRFRSLKDLGLEKWYNDD